MTTLDFASPSFVSSPRGAAPSRSTTTGGLEFPERDRNAGVAVTALHDELWRITRTTGEVLGYIERFVERGEHRFRAKRMLVRQQRFVGIGDFWRMDDALDCFRSH
ncbi:MAG: hypothetical protein ACOH1T_04075 [Microbacteriaceae bacterium]